MNKSILTFFLGMGLILASCNTPKTPAPDPDMLTAAASTVQVVLTPLASATVTIATRTVTAIPATPSLTPTITPTITPTYSVPLLTIKENTNCRTGPGQEYEIVFTFLPGATAEIVGQYPQDNYWVVKLPNSNETCWAWGQYATANGSFWAVPTLQPPPTKTPAPPEAPTGLSYDYVCTFNGIDTDINVNLKWTDRSDGEEGFRVLRDGEVVAQLIPNATTYSEVHATDVGKQVSYTVEVFRGSQTARSGTISFSCQ